MPARANGLYDERGDPWIVVFVMDVPCPHCGAGVGQYCHTPLGVKAKIHNVRQKDRSAAQSAADVFHARGRS